MSFTEKMKQGLPLNEKEIKDYIRIITYNWETGMPDIEHINPLWLKIVAKHPLEEQMQMIESYLYGSRKTQTMLRPVFNCLGCLVFIGIVFAIIYCIIWLL